MRACSAMLLLALLGCGDPVVQQPAWGPGSTCTFDETMLTVQIGLATPCDRLAGYPHTYRTTYESSWGAVDLTGWRIVVTSRSPKTVSASVRGMGVAVITR